MRRWQKVGLAQLLAGMAVGGLALAWAVGEARDGWEMAHQDKHEVARMTGKMKTVCVGRFLLDLPEEAHVEFTRPRVAGLDIAVFDETDDAFRARMDEREAQLRKTPDRHGGARNLESAKEVKTANGLAGKLFVHGRTVTEGTQANGLELGRYRYEGVAVEAMVHGQGISIDLSADSYYPERVDKVARLIAQLVPNPENKVPALPGYCIPRAYFMDPLSADQGEEITMLAELPSHPDVQFLLLLAAGVRPDKQALLERAADEPWWVTLEERRRISRLRAGVRTAAGIVGEELVERVREENDATVYTLWWEVNGKEDDVFTPHFVFKMNTGRGAHGPVPSSLSEGAALALWDKIMQSIRVRPTRLPAAAQAAPEGPPIGTRAWAGEPCPGSGWWLCGEGGDGVTVLGGRRQYMRQGQRMPQALLLPPQTLWEKVRGVQPSFESATRTSWKLVDRRSRQRAAPPMPLASPAPPLPGGDPIAVGATVGATAMTGSVCLASGWWRCEEPNSLDGARWFVAGSVFPAATFAVDVQTARHKSGAPAYIQRRASWRLVRPAPTDGSVDDQPDSGGAGSHA